MINSVYGKTMENLRKRINVRLVNNAKDCLKYRKIPVISSSNLKQIFHPGYKPIYIYIYILYIYFTFFSLRGEIFLVQTKTRESEEDKRM